MKEYAIIISKLKKLLADVEDETLHGMLDAFIGDVTDEYDMQKDMAKDYKAD